MLSNECTCWHCRSEIPPSYIALRNLYHNGANCVSETNVNLCKVIIYAIQTHLTNIFLLRCKELNGEANDFSRPIEAAVELCTKESGCNSAVCTYIKNWLFSRNGNF